MYLNFWLQKELKDQGALDTYSFRSSLSYIRSGNDNITIRQDIFGSDSSPRRWDLVQTSVCASVRPCVWQIIQKNIENEFLKHSKESRRVLGQGAQDGAQDGAQERAQERAQELY